jgi:hypothetical protein
MTEEPTRPLRRRPGGGRAGQRRGDDRRGGVTNDAPPSRATTRFGALEHASNLAREGETESFVRIRLDYLFDISVTMDTRRAIAITGIVTQLAEVVPGELRTFALRRRSRDVRQDAAARARACGGMLIP